MTQEEVDIFECLHEMIRSIRDLDDGEIETDTESEIESTPEETDDEIQQMMQRWFICCVLEMSYIIILLAFCVCGSWIYL